MYERILVTGANGDIADAIGRILQEHYPDVRLSGADAAGEWPGRAVFADFHHLPLAASDGYGTALTTLAERLRPDLIVPTSEAELRAIAETPEAYDHLPLLSNPPEVLLPFLDKLATNRWLDGIGIPVPKTTMLADAEPGDLPVVVKPRSGQGSKDITVVETPEQLRLVQKNADANLVAQELVGSSADEFTCAMVQPGDEVLTLVMRRRLLGGLSSDILVEDQPEIESMLLTIAKAMPSFIMLNVQLRLTDVGPRIFEINPRFSSTAMMRHRIGFCDLAWVCDARLGHPAPSVYSPPVGARVFRRFTELVIPT